MLPGTERAVSRMAETVPARLRNVEDALVTLCGTVDLMVTVLFAHVVHETQIPADEMAKLVAKARAELDRETGKERKDA